MPEATIYTLTARTNLRYRLRDKPSEVDGVLLRKNDSINILGEVLHVLNVIRLTDLQEAAIDTDYTLRRVA